MWYIEKPRRELLETYASLLLPSIKKRINEKRLDDKFKALCDYLWPINGKDNIIKEILIAEPKRLFKLNYLHLNNLLSLFYPRDIVTPSYSHFRYSEKQLRHYLKAKKKRKRKRRDNFLICRYDDLFNFLFYIFDYNIVKGEIATQIAYMKNINTCPYCNRLYTFTIVKSGGKNIIRPHFDHWFAHSHYPLMSLSFYNLIPSCFICNSSVKGDKHFSLKTHIHPYMSTSADPNFKFRPDLKIDNRTGKVQWGVIMKRDIQSCEDRMIHDFALEEMYDCHGELEVKDIMNFVLKNNPTYLHDLFSSTCLNLREEYTSADVYRMMFGVEGDREKSFYRPLSKLKRDILEAQGIFIE